MIDYRPLLERLAQRMRDEGPTGETVVLTPSQIAAQEARLGYGLHPLLAEVYGRLADGGFGATPTRPGGSIRQASRRGSSTTSTTTAGGISSRRARTPGN